MYMYIIMHCMHVHVHVHHAHSSIVITTILPSLSLSLYSSVKHTQRKHMLAAHRIINSEVDNNMGAISDQTTPTNETISSDEQTEQ